MNKIVLSLALLLMCSSASAFSFKDLLTKENVENVVSTVAGGQKITPASINGTWTYKDSAVKLESENAFTEIAGSAATSQIEEKLDSTLAKVGISSGLMTFTFNEDETFSCKVKNRELHGTYTIDEEYKITMKFNSAGGARLGKVTAQAEMTFTTLSLLFKADKLLDIVDTITSVTGNSTLAAANSLLSKYDGIMLGFDFTR